jgi:hypothetical protein
MKAPLFALLLAAPSSCVLAAEVPGCFVGRWKSNEAKTLEDMRRHPEVTAKARALFENNFFGRLVLVISPRHSAGYLEGKQSPVDMTFEVNDVVEAGPAHMVLRTKLMGVTSTQKWFCEGEEIYGLTSRWEFREYFSRLP